MAHIVYVLESVPKPRTSYVGYTNDLKQRLRRHNGEIKGGARFTDRHSFRPWCIAFYVTCEADWFDNTAALRLEWALHRVRHQERVFRSIGRLGFTRRFNGLIWLFNQPRWTTRSHKYKMGSGMDMKIFVHEKDVAAVRTAVKDCRFWNPAVYAFA